MRKRKARKETRKEERPPASVSVLDLAAIHLQERCEAAEEAAKPVFGTNNWKKKIASESMGCNAGEVAERIAMAKAHGINVEFDSKNRPVFDNSRAMREYAKQLHNWRHYQY